MLSKRILNSHIHYRKLMFATKLKPVVSLCQVKDFAYNVKPLLSRQYHDPHTLSKPSSSQTNSLIIMDLDKFDFSVKNLSGADTVATLSKLLKLCREEGLPPTKIVNKDFFNNLCVLINSQADNLTLSETLRCLDLFRKLKVDMSSGYILNLLDHLYTFSKTASFSDISRIMKVVEKLPVFPSTEQVETCLKNKIADKLRTEGYQNDFEFLVEAFRFTYLYMKRNKNILDKMINALESHDFDTKSPQHVLSLLNSINSSGFYLRQCDEILKKVINALIKNMSVYRNKDIVILIEQFVVRIKDQKLQQFYNEKLIDEAVNKLVSSKCSLDEGLVCMSALIDLAHANNEFLNYMSDKIHQEMKTNRKYIKFYTYSLLLKGFAYFKYKPHCWEEFTNYFQRTLKSETKENLYTAFYLACLNHYEPHILEAIFESEFEFEKDVYFHAMLLKLYQKLKTTPGYIGPLPSRKQVESFELLMPEKTSQKFNNSLYPDLTKAFGGPEYVKRNVRSKLYHIIDYVVVFQPGGNPLAFNNIKNDRNSAASVEYLENLNIPPDCQVVAVIKIPKVWSTRNTREIVGTCSTEIDTLEALQCHVVPIKLWELSSCNSRPDFLIDCIRKKLKIKS